MNRQGRLTIAVLVMEFLFFSVGGQAKEECLQLARKVSSQLTKPVIEWNGPLDGPAAQAGKTVVYIAEDLRNGGILAVGEGIRQAVRVIGWQVHFFDIGTKDEKRAEVFAKALAMKPDGIILGGGDAISNKDFLVPFQERGIPVVSWHAAPFPGPVAGTPVAVNITSNSLEVARAAAHYVLAEAKDKAGIVIFTDSRFAIARKKSDAMAEIIRACKECTLLSVEDVSLAETSSRMPQVTRELLERFGTRWTHSLGINDLYFDHSVATLIMMGHLPTGPPFNISAGDGSSSAFLRISNNSYQKATVPEPLLFHGWQLIDELNRLFAGEGPSGYVIPPHIVTVDNIEQSITKEYLYDPNNGYRDIYRCIWKNRKP